MRQASDLVTARLRSKAEDYAISFKRWKGSRPDVPNISLSSDAWDEEGNQTIECRAVVMESGSLAIEEVIETSNGLDLIKTDVRQRFILDRDRALALAQFITEMYS
jgi:hypothetical protein